MKESSICARTCRISVRANMWEMQKPLLIKRNVLLESLRIFKKLSKPEDSGRVEG